MITALKFTKLKNTKAEISHLFAKIGKKELKKLLPNLYIFFVVSGLVLTGIHYSFYPGLTTCSSFFGEEFCTPTGIFVAILVSLPGYVITGNILKFASELPGYVSFVIVFLSSWAFYYLVGIGIDRQRGKPITVSTVSKIVVIVVFMVLVLLVLSLV